MSVSVSPIHHCTYYNDDDVACNDEERKQRQKEKNKKLNFKNPGFEMRLQASGKTKHSLGSSIKRKKGASEMGSLSPSFAHVEPMS